MTSASRTLDIRHLVVEEAELSRANGVNLVANRLAREQVRQGHNARAFVLHDAARPVDLTDWNVPVHALALEGRRLFGHLVHLAPGLVDTLLADVDDTTVVHIHGGRRPMLLSIGRELARRGVRYVITIHGRYAHVYDEHLRAVRPSSVLYLSVFERRMLEKAVFVHALTEHEAATIQHIAPRARIEIVANAAYSSAFDPLPQVPAHRHTSDAFPTFGFCGRYALKHKGLDLLLGGFALHCARGGAGNLAFAGTGTSGREQLQAMAQEEGIAERVAVGPPVFGADKVRTLNGWDFFVQTARFDGMPIGALEAAMSGLPLIVSVGTGLGGPVERFGAGFVVTSLSAEAVATAIASAAQVTPDAWLRMSRAAYAMALDVGDWTRSARQLSDLYMDRVEAPLGRLALV